VLRDSQLRFLFIRCVRSGANHYSSANHGSSPRQKINDGPEENKYDRRWQQTQAEFSATAADA
jgi:hypothetical protein